RGPPASPALPSPRLFRLGLDPGRRAADLIEPRAAAILVRLGLLLFVAGAASTRAAARGGERRHKGEGEQEAGSGSGRGRGGMHRSDEHTSELQSLTKIDC